MTMQPKTLLERFSDWLNGEDVPVPVPDPQAAPAHTVESILAECRRLWPDVEWKTGSLVGLRAAVFGTGLAGSSQPALWPSDGGVTALFCGSEGEGPDVRSAALAAMAAAVAEQTVRAEGEMDAASQWASSVQRAIAGARMHRARVCAMQAEIAALSGRS